MSAKLQKRRPQSRGRGIDVVTVTPSTDGVRYEDIPAPPPGQHPTILTTSLEPPSITMRPTVFPPLQDPHSQLQYTVPMPAKPARDDAHREGRAQSLPPPSKSSQQRDKTFQPPLRDSTRFGPQAPSTLTPSSTRHPHNCAKCKKQRPASLEAVPATGVGRSLPQTMNSSGRLHAPRLPKCGPGCSNCVQCGGGDPSPRLPRDSRSNLYFSAPRAVPEAHFRSASDPAIRGLQKPSVLESHIVDRPDNNAPPGKYQHCHKCGKPKRPALSSTPLTPPQTVHPHQTRRAAHQAEQWPLTPPWSPPETRSSPFVGSDQSYSPYQVDSDVSPLVTQKNPDFRSPGNGFSRTYLSQIQETPSRTPSLLRRISNAVRPARVLVYSPQSANEPKQDYLNVPTAESAERPGSAFSFVASDFEMLPLTASNAPVKEKRERSHASGNAIPAHSPRVYTQVPTTEEVLPVQTPEQRSEDAGIQRNDSVLQRAVSGSIRRFKSLRGAHHGWYRSDMAIEGHAYGYGEEPAGRMVNAY